MKQRESSGTRLERDFTPRLVPPAPPVPAEPGAELARRRSVAVFVCHGMGQQVRFETIDTVARGLHAHVRALDPTVPPPIVRLAKLGDEILGRAEITLPHDDSQTDVHVYEGYWAPLTEGRITLRDTVLFLVKSGWQGLMSPRLFYRFLFGQFISWPVNRLKTAGQFLLALLVLASLIAINAIQAAAILAWILQAQTWLPREVVPALGKDVIVFFVVPVGVLAALYGLRFYARDKRAGRRLDSAIAIACYIAAGFVVLAASVMSWHAVEARLHPGPPASPTPWVLVANAGLWLAVAVASLLARWWILQFGGDIAIYLSGYRLSVFDELRDKIQAVCYSAARAVYEHGSYDQHVFLGHSLGSVVAYDTLNQLLVDEGVKKIRDVRGRTRGFITFGSPLDKTAYLFRVQVERDAEVREALATAVQPLIADYANRPEWVNLWSPADIISAHLDYYDDPGAGGYHRGRVRNHRDKQATVPIAAHTEYWMGRALYRHLYRMATTPR